MAIRFTFAMPTTVLIILCLTATLAQARSIPGAALADEKLHLGLNGYGGLGIGADIKGLPLIGGLGGFAGGAGGGGLHLGGNGLGETGSGALGGGGLGGGSIGGIAP